MTARTWLPALAFAAALAGPSLAAGTLKPIGTPDAPIQIVDHHVDVVINNGFARTEVTQTFFNPNVMDLEAIYTFPIPRSASLSELTIFTGEVEINGEVLPKEKAREIYEQERDQGNDTGLAEKNGFYTFDFFISPVRANDKTRVRFLYYQPVEIDTGVGRYLYPLEEGGTDEAALRFWTTNDVVEGTFSARLELKSAWPVTNVRLPGLESQTQIQELGEGHYLCTLERTSARLDTDLVLYYKLADDLPGRVEMLAHRAGPGKPGTFMMVLTPGLDLQPLTGGSNYVFVLDVSGSMSGSKVRTLARGVGQTIGQMNPADRYRLIAFNTRAWELSRGWTSATPENVRASIAQLEGLRAQSGTNLYAGLRLALDDLDDDRVTSVVLVTDAVTNTGEVNPAKFHQLMKTYDVRVFGFLMGNSANWPLMRTVCDASGGFYAGVSNADDIVGQIMLAKGKITHESLHDASLSIKGVDAFETTGDVMGKVYHGQQVVVFGRYDKAGEATVTLDAALSGEDRTYTTRFAFPETDTLHPEIERLWALARIDDVQTKTDAGLMSPGESEHVITSLGVDYQIVTDHTSMVVVADQAFEDRGIERRNLDRVTRERQAQTQRSAQPTRAQRVDASQPMFHNRPAPNVGGGRGGGAIDPVSGAIAVGLGALALVARRRRRAS